MAIPDDITMSLSLSGKLMNSIMEIGDKNDRCLTIAKGTGMLLLAPIGLIEGIVRGVLALLATPVALFLPEGKMREWYGEHIFSPLAEGSVVCFDSFIMGLCVPPLAFVGALRDMDINMPPSIWCCCTQTSSESLDSEE